MADFADIERRIQALETQVVSSGMLFSLWQAFHMRMQHTEEKMVAHNLLGPSTALVPVSEAA